MFEAALAAIPRKITKTSLDQLLSSILRITICLRLGLLAVIVRERRFSSKIILKHEIVHRDQHQALSQPSTYL